MSQSKVPCLTIAIAPLNASASSNIPTTTGGTNQPTQPTSHFAIWVLKAPYPGGYVHYDCIWSDTLTQTWLRWQQMFSPDPPAISSIESFFSSETDQPTIYSSRLMLELGTNLWQFIFSGSIASTFAQSLGMAIGKQQPLRVQLDIRDPNLIALPWEIGQSKPGKPAISLNPQLRFSRTTSDVDPLSKVTSSDRLNTLLVLGSDEYDDQNTGLQLQQEADTLKQILSQPKEGDRGSSPVPGVTCHVDSLIQPTLAELIQHLENGNYNIIFYAGHGVKALDGGQLLLRSDTTLSGTELAQILVDNGVTLAVFNACWGAQPFIDENQQANQRSSLAEVLIHHGLPAVLAMRDEITDEEALSFIQTFATELSNRIPVDRAVAIARQKLLTLYKFNQPAWSLPVLYMHPEFNGELIQPWELLITELPDNSIAALNFSLPVALLRTVPGQVKYVAPNTPNKVALDKVALDKVAPDKVAPDKVAPDKVWQVQGGRLTVGRRSDNNLVIQERWVSQQHAEVFYRDISARDHLEPSYFLRDFSRYGTLVFTQSGWQKIHHQEVPLKSGVQLRFGSSQGLTLEFVILEES